MKKQSIAKDRRMGFNLTQEDYVKIESFFKESTKRKLAEYIRAVLLQKPVTFYTRDKSLDDLVEELLALRMEFSAISNDFNQLVKSLARMVAGEELGSILPNLENHHSQILRQMQEINQKIAQIADRWLQG